MSNSRPMGKMFLLDTCLSPDPGAAPKCQNPFPGERWLSQIPVGSPPTPPWGLTLTGALHLCCVSNLRILLVFQLRPFKLGFSGPKTFRSFRETGPRSPCTTATTASPASVLVQHNQVSVLNDMVNVAHG